MFDIGGLELLLIAVVGLLVIGPERLPEALRTLGLWLGRLRRSFTSVKAEIEKEIGMDEVRRQLHNEAVMEEMKRIEKEVQAAKTEATIDPNPPPAVKLPDAPTPQTAHLDMTPAPPAEQPSEAVQPEADAEGAEPETPLPPTDAELEAEWRRKQAREAQDEK